MTSTVKVKIQPEIINWVLERTSVESLGSDLMNNIEQWLDGTKLPTFKQIEKFSKKTNIPLGYFFLKQPPIEQIELLEYRTINSFQFSDASRNLIDTIHEMEQIQDWMINYRKELGFDKLAFVGSMRDEQNVAIIAERILSDLGLKKNWYESCNDIRESFKKVRKHLEDSGVVVMMNGIVGKNTRRVLDANEFRAFAMINEWAPLIFINASDSQSARLFSLMHEIAHIWLGENDLFNDRQITQEKVSKLEVLCNKIASELIVPRDIFLNKWESMDNKKSIPDTISDLAKGFRCGQIVAARKAFELKFISQDEYNLVVQNAIENYHIVMKKKKQSGGDYYKTMSSRLDACFVRALCESISIGRTSYTEAYRLTNTSSKTFCDVCNALEVSYE